MSSAYAQEVCMECIIMYQLTGSSDLEKWKKNGRKATVNELAGQFNNMRKVSLFPIGLSVRSGEIFPRGPATQKGIYLPFHFQASISAIKSKCSSA